jgi:hypothetical protein
VRKNGAHRRGALAQAAVPFGANLGGVNPLFFAIPQCDGCAYDSWLSVGATDGSERPGRCCHSDRNDSNDSKISIMINPY